MTFELEVCRRTDLDKTCSLPGPETAGEDDDEVVIVKTVLVDEAADGALER